MNTELTLAEKSLLGNLNKSMNTTGVTVKEIANIMGELKNPILERVALINKIQVTPESMATVKENIRDIKKVVDNIDNFRKKSKKELMNHFEPIETVCKELKIDVDEAVAPIKESIAECEAIVKEEKKVMIDETISEILTERGYEDVSIIEFDNKWYNASKKALKQAVNSQIDEYEHTLKEKEILMASYQNLIDIENKKMIYNMTIDEFSIDGKEQGEVMSEIAERAEKYRKVESEIAVSMKEDGEKEDSSMGVLLRVYVEPERTEEVISLLQMSGIYSRAE